MREYRTYRQSLALRPRSLASAGESAVQDSPWPAERIAEQQALFADHVADGLWDWHVGEGSEYIAAPFWRLLGYEAVGRAVSQQAWLALVHPDDQRLAQANLVAHVMSRGAFSYDFCLRYRHRADYWTTVRRSGKVVQWAEDGSPLRMVGYHCAAQAGRPQALSSALCKAMGVGVWEWLDIEHDYCEWSPDFTEMLGYDCGELDQSMAAYQALLHPEDLEASVAALHAHLQGKARYVVEHRLRLKSGEYHWFEARGCVLRDGDGRPVRMVGAIQDITQRKTEQEELWTLHLRNQLALQAAQIGVWDYDLTTDDVTWDAQTYQLYDVRPGEFPSMRDAWYERTAYPDRAEAEEAIVAALHEKKPLNAVFRIRRPSGAYRYLRTVGAAITCENGRPLRFIGVNWDVTQQENTEQVLKRRNSDLTAFAYAVSHDLKTPVRAIASVLWLLERDIQAGKLEQVPERIRCIRERIGRLDRLFAGALNYLQVDSTDISAQAVPLAEVMAGLAETCRMRFPNFEFRVEGRMPVLAASLAQVEIVFGNLLENACKHHNQESGTVTVVSRDAGKFAQVLVCDDGPGIAPEHHLRVFEPFRSVNTDEQNDGSGIGLAVVKKIVEGRGGRVWIEPSALKGACISVCWPIWFRTGREE